MTLGAKPTDLTCEYLENPRGLTVAQPRLSWIIESDRRGQRQTAYRILVADTKDALEVGEGNLWDSGRVVSNQTTQIPYNGRPLTSGQLCYWTVQIWDENGEASEPSAPAFWQTGLLSLEDWHAKWIGIHSDPEPELGIHPGVHLRRAFKVERPIARATLYATAKGVYIPSLNGSRVGAAELAPGWTDYDQRIQVQAYEVTEQLHEGENVLGITLGDGWYSGYLGFKGLNGYYGDYPRALAQIAIEYADGSDSLIVSDDQWRASPGAIVYADIQMGERYDARRENPGWDAPGFDAETWQSVIVDDLAPDVALVGQPDQPMRVTEETHPIEIRERGSDRYIVDMGQNMVGWVRLRVAGPTGTEVRLRYGEVLEPDGSLHTANLRSARATDFYVLKGDGEEVFEPHFTYHGFRYVEVKGYPGELGPDALTGRVMHNDMDQTGAFECSNPMVNQLWRNILWGQRGNFVSVPTDCPQRDERLGWMGDAQIFVRTASFNMDVAAFFTKWMDDIVDAQMANGAFTDIVPQIDGMNEGAPAWGDAGIIVPWTIYQVYGDTEIIRRHYDAMQRWMRYIAEANPLLLRTKRLNNNYSDWVALEGGSSAEQIATAYWAKITRMMAEMATAIGRDADAVHYIALYEEIRQTYIAAYVHPDGRVETGTQTAYVMALANDLLPEELRESAADHLVEAIERRDGHLATGFLGTPELCFVLAETGHLDVAYQLLNNESYPSWGYMIKNGATTMWERWDGYTEENGIHDPGMNSFNHYAYGSIGEWLYRVVAGIEAGLPGYREVHLRPRPGGGLDYVRASYRSAHGTIQSAWRREDDGTHVEVTIPANTTAVLEIPTQQPHAVTEGDAPADEADGVHFLRYEQGVAVFALASGSYHFVAK
ncbi:MAG: family 78 glycoside hydrolase catalytic domain [Anaerolineae bacterium]